MLSVMRCCLKLLPLSCFAFTMTDFIFFISYQILYRVERSGHRSSSPLDPLLAGLLSVFIVTTAIVFVVLFLKFRQRTNHPEFHRLQDLPMVRYSLVPLHYHFHHFFLTISILEVPKLYESQIPNNCIFY